MKPTADGGSLRVWLLSLVMVPIIGVGLAAASVISAHASTVQADKKVESIVQGSIELDHVRMGLQAELLPAMTKSILTDVDILKQFHLTAAQVALFAGNPSDVSGLRKTTDAALDKVIARPDLGAIGRQFQARLKSLRNTIDQGAQLHNTFTEVMAAVYDLAAVQNSQTALAMHYGLDASTTKALKDLDLVSRAVQFGGQLAAYFAAAQFPGAVAPAATAQQSWVQSWGSSRSGSESVTSQASPEIAAEWQRTMNLPIPKELNAIFDSTVVSAKPLGLATTIKVVMSDPKRVVALSTIEDTTANKVLASAKHQQSSATTTLLLVILLCLLVIAISLLAARRAQRALTGPLNRLAFQADKVSQGELIDVAVSGPREVRTVARGLAAAVNSLRMIESQAAAVADGDLGDLESSVVAQPVPGPLGALMHASVERIVSALRDRERAQEALAHRAAHDPLTELPNRARALAQIDSALHRAQRTGSMTAVMFVDLDHFKAVNDTFGHAAGDTVLRTMARRMQQIMRTGDTVARLGGDEFVILAEAIEDEGACFHLAERVVEAASLPIEIDGREVRVGASVGVALCREGQHVDASRLLREADAAVYRAKSAGRGRIGIYDDDLRTEIANRFELEQAIVNALENDEFLLYYQPVVDLVSGTVHGMEALIRWNRPGFGMVPPDEFIPIAEYTTLINDIGRWVLKTATTQLAEWIALDPDLATLTMSVNISGRHLISPQLPEEVADALTHSGVDPRQLVIELTETVLVDNIIAKKNMHQLREQGVLIAIDDFGTGYTSIGQLPMLPVDILKIDRSFVSSTEPGNQDLMRLMVAAAHAFDLSVVAEGIEYEHQADTLRNANVEIGQGYFFARPCTAEDVLGFIRESVHRADAAPLAALSDAAIDQARMTSHALRSVVDTPPATAELAP
ncbi:diguanylate cyclase (GGDEF) domain-containing protein [Frankineae bacterium MT45]|nr:diguanylate cyclase (GGDEF) domain-containing protein [Frankineae bacterium MT45]